MRTALPATALAADRRQPRRDRRAARDRVPRRRRIAPARAYGLRARRPVHARAADRVGARRAHRRRRGRRRRGARRHGGARRGSRRRRRAARAREARARTDRGSADRLRRRLRRRGDDVEDADAVRAAKRVAAAAGAGFAPPFIGIRFKSFEAKTRARGIRTLDLFVTALLEHGGLPDGLALTLPKVSTVAQVEAMAEVAAALERAHGLPDGRLRFEVQVETPQLILGADGTRRSRALPLAVPGRISALHYGTYDYSAVAADRRRATSRWSIRPPTSRRASCSSRSRARASASPTGRRTSCRSAIAPKRRGDCTRGSCAGRSSADSRRAGTCTRSSCRPGSSRPTRSTARVPRRIRTAARLLRRRSGAVLDEPATVRALAGFVLRGVRCGAISAAEVAADTGIDEPALVALAHPSSTTERPATPRHDEETT